MSLASAIRQPVAIYREEQNFAWWIYALLILMASIGVLAIVFQGYPRPGGRLASLLADVPIAVAVGFLLPSLLIIGVLRLTTIVTPHECRVWFGWIPIIQHRYSLVGVQCVSVIEYRPIADYGGWGLRQGPSGERVYNARGNRGVRLAFQDGSCIVIGSQQPEELAKAIDQAVRNGN